jgi:2-oxoglutarate ferredoxin oxidoreductase subunit alpha
MTMRHMHPMPNGLEKVLTGYQHVIVAEINDQGLYGNGQLATLLRARFCDPKIKSVTKTDGLGFQVREIIAGVEKCVKG